MRMRRVRIGNEGSMSAVLMVLLCVTLMPAMAQQGDPAIWNTKQSSSAFIDASAFCSTRGRCKNTVDDFCNVVYTAMTTLPASGGVVDARGINPSNTKSNSCSSTTPFTNGTSGIKAPSTLLLPAGTIPIDKTWVLPNGTKIIGRGAGASSYTVTTLAASSTFTGNLIQMGPSSTQTLYTACSAAPLGYCTEVGVEDLSLQGNANTTVGIINGQSEDMSYVRRVSMYQIGGIGLKIWQGRSTTSGHNSGPYSDITFDTGSVTGSSTTVCAEILTVSTRGIHGLTCTMERGTAPFAVQVDSSNNSVKDVLIQGAFTDGVQVTSTASSNVLLNVTGVGVTNLIHLESGNMTPNLSVMGASSSGGTYTMLDSVTSTMLNDPYIAMYVVGASGVGGNGYSRYTTSTNPSAVTWGVGSSVPTTASCSKGSLFSDTSGTLYACTESDMENAWASLP